MADLELGGMLTEQAPDAVIFADQRGVIREWNLAAERIFGYANDEAVGESLDLIVPERFREAHWRGYDQALSEGQTKYSGKALPTRSVRKDGSTIYVELTFAIVHDQTGSVIGALAHAGDITERWEQERQQRQRIRELEQAPR
jgi:PAS domain S-box-containing protein